MIKKYYKSIVLSILFFISIFLFSFQSRAEIGDGAIWTGWASCESGSEGGRSAGSDGGHAFGLFQFDDRYESLYRFLQHCLDIYFLHRSRICIA